MHGLLVEHATHKPVRSFRHVDDTFVVWPHGREKVTEFLNHLIGFHKNIHFTMEKDEEDRLPSVGVCVTQVELS
jgi:hypothetical protein